MLPRFPGLKVLIIPTLAKTIIPPILAGLRRRDHEPRITGMNNKYSHLHIGVLALQGDYLEHQRQLTKLGVDARQVKLPNDLEGLDALIIPGGETTTMSILLDRFSLREPLAQFARSKPVYGTCAGMIMLATKIEKNLSKVVPLSIMDIDVLRNGYGRQVFSFETKINLKRNAHRYEIKASFIRAPKVVRVGPKVEVLAEYEGSPLLVKEGQALAAAFHAELYDNTELLEYFLDLVIEPD